MNGGDTEPTGHSEERPDEPVVELIPSIVGLDSNLNEDDAPLN